MARASRSSLRFTHLRLKNWRNFREVDLDLDRRAFFVGPNASGKSNLLDALRFLSEIARPGGGGLQAAIDQRLGFSAIRCLHARKQPWIEMDVSIGTDDDPKAWRYRLQINRKPGEKFPTVAEEEVWRGNEKVAGQLRETTADAFQYRQTLMEQAARSVEFRELAEFFESCRYLHVVPQIVRDRDRAHKVGEDPYGGDLLRRMKAMPKKTRDPRLKRISKALGLAVPQFNGLTLEDDADGVPHLKAAFEHWRGRASNQPEGMFSDGTLRLIGLLWSISEKGGTLLLEEPELSLNDAVVSQLPQMFSNMQKLSSRQVIATTHSPALLGDDDIGLTEVHLILVDSDGSHVETISDNKMIAAQVGGGMTISQAVFPLLAPSGIENFGKVVLAG